MSVREQMKIHTVDENIYWYSQFGQFELKKKKNTWNQIWHRDLGLGSKIYKEKKENDYL